MSTRKEFFPDFDHSASQIVKYRSSIGFFTMLLTNDHIVNYLPSNNDTEEDFRNWLQSNHILDIRMCG